MSKFIAMIGRSICDFFYSIQVGYSKLRRRINPNYSPGMRSRRANERIFYYTMLLLPITQFLIFYVGTNVNSFLLAFKDYISAKDFVWSLKWIEYAATAFFNDQVLKTALRNSFVLWVILLLTMPLKIIIAFYFYKKQKGHRFYRIIYFLPQVIVSVVTVTIFCILVDRCYPYIMENLFGVETLGLLVGGKTQFGVVIFYNIFYSTCGGFLYYCGAMSGIDNSISEAARIDGATPMQELRYITLPLIYSTVTVIFISGVADVFMADFGLYAFFPNSAPKYQTLGYYFIKSVKNATEIDYPRLSALGLVMSFFALKLTFIVRALINYYDPMRDRDAKKAKRKEMIEE